MAIFHRGKTYRLEDHEPEKARKERTIQRAPKPPRPLSWLSCGILLVFAAALFAYAGDALFWHFAGVKTEAAVNTTLDEGGAVVPAEFSTVNAMQYTYRDAEGALHAGSGSMAGYFGAAGSTIAVRYLRSDPARSQPAFRSDDLMVPAGCVLLGVFLIWTAVSRLRDIRGKKEQGPPAPEET